MNSHETISLTVALPTLNAAKYLRDSVDSIRRSYPNAYIVVVDSGSSDGTPEIARELELKIEYFPPGNLYSAVNSILLGCTTEWVAYLNADDRIESSLIHRDDLDIVYGDQRFIDHSGAEIYCWLMAEPQAFNALLADGIMPIYLQGTLIRRELFNSLGGFDTGFRFSADFDFVMRSYLAGAKFFHGHIIAGAFRIHVHQLSQSNGDLMRSEVIASVRRAGLTNPFLSRFAALLFLRIRNIPGLWNRWRAHRRAGGRGIPRTTDVMVGKEGAK